MVKIILKYYNHKTRKIKKLDKTRTDEPLYRFKVFRNGKEFPCCDYGGICTNKAYAEVFPGMIKKGSGWSYLCKKHYYSEQKRLHNKLPACFKVEW